MNAASLQKIGAAAAGGAGPDRAKLRQAAQDFEAFFVTHLLGAMRKGMPDNPYLGQGAGAETFQELLDQEYGRAAARRGGFGIARTIEKAFLRERTPKLTGLAGARVDVRG